MSMLFFDSHAHFHHTDDPAPIIQRAVAAGVTRILAVGGSPELEKGALRALAVAPEHVYIALGFDRDQADKISKDTLSSFASRLATLNLCALGESGLDSITS